MLSATLKLLRLRVRLFINTFKHLRWTRKIFSVIGALMLAGFGGLIGYLSWSVVRALNTPEFRYLFETQGVDLGFADFIAQLPVYMLSLAFMMGLLANISVLLQTLYLTGDMEFLLAVPIPARAVFLSKMLQAVFPIILLLALLAAPALVGLGFAQSYSAAYFIFIPVFLLLFVLSGSGIAAILVMLIVRLVSPRRAAEAIALVGGITIFICSQSGQLAAGMDFDLLSGRQIAGLVDAVRPLAAPWNPIAWAGRALVAWGTADWAGALALTGLTVLVSSLIYTGTLVAAERLYLSGWARVTVSTRKKRRAKPAAGRTGGSSALSRMLGIPVQVQAIVMKDVRLFRRDLRNLSQLILPVIMAVVWGISFGNQARGSETEGQIISGFGIFIATMVAWGFSMRFGLGAFSLEGQQWWILKTAPLSRGRLLAAKFLVAYLPSFGLGVMFLAVLSLLTRRPFWPAAYDALNLGLVMAAMSSLMLAFGVWTAKFDWKDPREVQGGGATGCLVSLTSMAAILMFIVIFQGLPRFLIFVLDWTPPGAYGLSVGIGGLLCLVVGTVPLLAAAGRVDRLGE